MTKVLVDPKSERILGIGFVGVDAAEMISGRAKNCFALDVLDEEDPKAMALVMALLRTLLSQYVLQQKRRWSKVRYQTDLQPT